MIRRIDISDYNEIERLFKQREMLPKFDGMKSQYIDADNNRILTYANLRSINEAILLIDKSLPLRDRVEQLKQAVQILKQEARHHKVNLVYAFAEKGFDEILISHYGFKPCKGKALYLDIEG